MNALTRRQALAAAASLLCAPALAQQSRIMRLVVPFPPGGSTDALARMLQARLQGMLGQTTIVENMPGAASSLGAANVAKSAPDGMTLLVTFDSHTVIPAMVEHPPLDIEKDLVPVSLVGTAPYVLATHKDKPFKTFKDVLDAAKARPRAVTYASVGVGTIGHRRVRMQVDHVCRSITGRSPPAGYAPIKHRRSTRRAPKRCAATLARPGRMVQRERLQCSYPSGCSRHCALQRRAWARCRRHGHQPVS